MSENNYENINNADVTPTEEIVTETLETEATDTLLELETLSEEKEKFNPEKNMTVPQKLRVLLMKPLSTSVIKWSFIPLGIIALVLYLIGTSSREMGESFAKTFGFISAFIASIFSFIPISVIEILMCAVALAIFAYLVFIIVKTFIVKGLFHKLGLWVQFLYTLISISCVFALLISLCYGIYTYREPLSKSTDYSNGKVTNQELSETMLYLIDNINNTLFEGIDNKTIFFTASGFSRYASSGRSTTKIAKEISEAFENASTDIETLKGADLTAKELLFSPLYSKYQISSIYSPITGELCINTDYPEVLIPMQIAKTMAMQRGYTEDSDASYIAYIVCTEYSDDVYIRYSGYFNAYLELSSKLYNESGKNLHLHFANTLRDKAKKEYVQLVKKLDTLYGTPSEIQYTASETELPPEQYCDVAKLMIYDIRKQINSGNLAIDNSEPKNYGKYCNFLVNHYKLDSDFQYEINETYDEYHPTLN